MVVINANRYIFLNYDKKKRFIYTVVEQGVTDEYESNQFQICSECFMCGI